MSKISLLRLLALGALTAIASAQSLTGIVVDSLGAPIPGVAVLLSNAGGTQLTDAVGVFTFPLLQNRTYTVSFQPPATQWAPRQMSFRVQGVSTMGSVALPDGARVFGVVVDQNGAPVANANLDAFDTVGNTLYTPGDSTDVTGSFSVTVPLGQTLVRMNPPGGQTLVRFETNVLITGPLDLGVIRMPQAYAVTGSVVDANTSLPIGALKVWTYDNITGTEILQPTPNSNNLGAFTLYLPIGVHRLEFDPPTGNAHAARVLHSVPVFGPTALGLVRMTPGIQVSGTVTGPAGPVANCDLDILTADNHKVFTLHDNTSATGAFSVFVPPGNYRVRIDPPPATGLFGVRTAVQPFSTSAVVPPIVLQPGVLLQLGVIGPLGFEVNADLDFTDPVTGEPVIIVGDKTAASGIMNAIVPTGLFDIAIDGAQGSTAAPFRIQAAIPGPVSTPLFLGQKQAVADLRPTFGIQSIAQNGTLFVDARLRNLTTADLPITLELAVVFPSGQELPIGGLPLSLLAGFDFTFGQVALPMPAVPATEVGKNLRLYLRLRDTNQQVLDQAYVEFVVE